MYYVVYIHRISLGIYLSTCPTTLSIIVLINVSHTSYQKHHPGWYCEAPAVSCPNGCSLPCCVIYNLPEDSINSTGKTMKDLHAGASAASSAEKVFVTSSPLSELVWCPRKGLSLKCVEASLAEKKAPLLWSTESFSIIISTPDRASAEKRDFFGSLASENLSPMHLETNPEDNMFNKVTLLGSPESDASIVPDCPMRSGEEDPGSCGSMQRLNREEEVSDIDMPPEHKEAGTCSPPRESQVIVCNRQPGSVSSNADKTSNKDSNNERSTDFLSCKLAKFTSNSEKIKAENRESNEGWSPEHLVVTEMDKNLISGGAVVSEIPMINFFSPDERLASIPRFQDSAHADSKHNVNGITNDRVILPLDYLHPRGKRYPRGVQSSVLDVVSSCHYSLKFLREGRNDFLNTSVTSTSQSSEKGEERTMPMLQKGDPHQVETNASKTMNPLIQRKDEEGVSDTGDKGCSSKERFGNHETVGSSNSEEPLSKGKRAWIYDPEMLAISKKVKKPRKEDLYSGVPLRKDSSFMNWLSNMAKGFKYDPVKRHSLVLVPKSFDDIYTNCSSKLPPISHDKNEGIAGQNIGFKSNFQALYHSKLKGQYKTAVNIDQPQEASETRQLQIDNKPSNYGGNQLDNHGMNVRLPKPFPESSLRLNQCICQFREFPPDVPNISSSDSSIQEKLKYKTGECCNLCYIGSSSSSFKNDSSSYSEAKEVIKVDIAVPKRSSNSSAVKKASGHPGSLWITRLFPKDSAVMSHALQCSQHICSAPKMFADDHMSICHSQDYIVYAGGHKNLEDSHRSGLKDQGVSMSRYMQDICDMNSYFSKKVCTDQKLQSTLNPILPTQKLKYLEPVASVFAKRSDALRHIKTSKIAGDEV